MVLLTIEMSVALFLLGILIGRRSKKETTSGALRIDTSEPDESPLLFLELNVSPFNLINKKRVTLDITTESYISQK